MENILAYRALVFILLLRYSGVKSRYVFMGYPDV